jgi:hypothetical protein
MRRFEQLVWKSAFFSKWHMASFQTFGSWLDSKDRFWHMDMIADSKMFNPSNISRIDRHGITISIQYGENNISFVTSSSLQRSSKLGIIIVMWCYWSRWRADLSMNITMVKLRTNQLLQQSRISVASNAIQTIARQVLFLQLLQNLSIGAWPSATLVKTALAILSVFLHSNQTNFTFKLSLNAWTLNFEYDVHVLLTHSFGNTCLQDAIHKGVITRW